MRKINKLKYIIPSLACITIFGIALACIKPTDPFETQEIKKPEKEVIEVEKKESEIEEETEVEEEEIIFIGDTIPELEGYDNLAVTFLSWIESNIAIAGPYSGDTYYTFTAKPEMKFIILFFEFKNNGVRAQEIPYINEGEIITSEKGYIYECAKQS